MAIDSSVIVLTQICGQHKLWPEKHLQLTSNCDNCQKISKVITLISGIFETGNMVHVHFWPTVILL